MLDHSPLSMMERETRVTHAPVPDTIAGLPVKIGRHRLVGDEFLLRDDGVAIFYRKGQGICVQLDDPAKAGHLELFLAGTVHSAVAAIGGLLPLHASAVAVGGRAIAFTGQPGAGKSTTAAALRQRGFAMVADDTLVLDTAAEQPRCLPGHKRLKLWPDSLALTGLSAQQLVSEEYPKYFATSGGSEVDEMLPLGAIVALETGDTPQLIPVRGAARVALLDDDHYTAQLHGAAHAGDPAARLTALAKVASAVPVWRFARPLDPARFDETVDFLSASVSALIEP